MKSMLGLRAEAVREQAERARRANSAGAAVASGAGLLLAGALVLGCGVAPGISTAPRGAGTALAGSVHGGIQPIANARIDLYAVSTSGYGAPAQTLLQTPVTTGADGSFSITNDYTCPSSSAIVYLAVTGGNPGVGGSANNPAISLIDVLGACSTLTPRRFVNVNELTTLSAVYALQPFLGADAAHIGTSPGNLEGLNAAAETLITLVAGSGFVPGAPPPGVTVPAAEINTLGDALASCVNSSGDVSPGAPCGRLFAAATPPSGPVPGDVFAAALDIVRNPAHNVPAIYNTVLPSAPYQPTLAAAPPDWTIGIQYLSPALRTPADLAIDSQQNVWVTSTPGTASSGSSTVVTLSAAGFTGTYPQVNASFARLAIDTADNAWLSDTLRSNIVELTGGGARASFAGFTGGGIMGPGPLAFDPAGTLWIANNSPSVSHLWAEGMALSPAGGYATGGTSAPVALAIDAAGNVWTVDGASNTVAKLTNTGAAAPGSPFAVAGLSSPFALAFDSASHLFVANRTGNTVSELSVAQAVPAATGMLTGGGLSAPIAVAIDGDGNAWVVNAGANGLSVFTPAGMALSGGVGLASAALVNPLRLAIDQAGSIWVANLGTRTAGSGMMTQIVGAAAPVTTPLAAGVKAGKPASRP